MSDEREREHGFVDCGYRIRCICQWVQGLGGGMGTAAAELRFGTWQDVLCDVGEVDTLISDPPYSERTHSGHSEGVERSLPGESRRAITYAAWKPEDVDAFVDAWVPRLRGWFVAMTDNVLAPIYEAALLRHGRYVFSPLVFMHRGRSVRLAGDGPAQWAVFIVVARPKTREFQQWGALPGGYVMPPKNDDREHIGGKPTWVMRALVRDYSRPGNLICDPCAGGGTTLVAARMEGRRALGAECDPATFELAQARLAKPYTGDLFVRELRERAVANDNATQGALWGEGEDGADVDEDAVTPIRQPRT